MNNSFNPYRLVEIDVGHIENNKKEVFDAWKLAWQNSFWGDRKFIQKEEISYLKELVSNSKAYLLKTEAKNIIAFAIISIEHFPNPKNNGEKNLFKNLRNEFNKLAFLHELVVNKNYRGKGLGGNYLIY